MTIPTKDDLPELALELNGLSIRDPGYTAFIARNSKGRSGSGKRRATATQQRREMAQLRREVGIKRIPVSVAVKDIIAFVSQHRSQDFLLGSGSDLKKTNPYKQEPLPTVLCLPLPFSRNRRRSDTM